MVCIVIVLVTEKLSAFITPSSSFTQSMVVVCIFHTLKISNLTEVSVMEMPASDMVFQEIKAHACTVDTRCSFSPPPSLRLGTRLVWFMCEWYVCVCMCVCVCVCVHV